MMIFGFLGLIALIIVGIYVIKWFYNASPSNPISKFIKGGGEDPLQILKQRYVNGEITREDYERMKKDIEN